MPTTRIVRGTAPGKVILFGEHAVVYGRTAVVGAIDRQVEVYISNAPPVASKVSPVPLPVLSRAAELIGISADALEVVVRSDLPCAVGLGSSAALSVALVRGLAQIAQCTLTDAALCAHAFELEKIFHGFPSGVDNTIATYGGWIAFRRDAPIAQLTVASPLPVVIAIGRAPRRTRETVTALRGRWSADPQRYEMLFDRIDRLAAEAQPAIATGDVPVLGELMNANHALLRDLGVSTAELDDLARLACRSGASGAKLTGGGGGGAVICVGDVERLLAAFARGGYHAFATVVAAQQRGHDARAIKRLDNDIAARP